MAYNMENDNCARGDYWLRNISTAFTPYWPFMPVPGNHDAGNNSAFNIFRSYFWSPD
jgi:hypothetical protein